KLALPDPTLTPGAANALPPAAVGAVSHPIPSAVKDAVARAYHLNPNSPAFVFDRLVPAALGGTDDPSNVWPEPLEEQAIKRGLEDHLVRQVQRGKLSLEEAQEGLATNWVQLWLDSGAPAHPGATDEVIAQSVTRAEGPDTLAPPRHMHQQQYRARVSDVL